MKIKNDLYEQFNQNGIELIVWYVDKVDESVDGALGELHFEVLLQYYQQHVLLTWFIGEETAEVALVLPGKKKDKIVNNMLELLQILKSLA